MVAHFDSRNKISVVRNTNGKLPSLPFARIKNEILGNDYTLSLVFPTLDHATELHQTWKQKPGPVNILSFPLSDSEGEIFISLSQARIEAPRYERTYQEHLTCLFIHGCVHLTGLDHGKKMDNLEEKFQKIFLKKK
jgi:probable rRNA maturation factor